MRVRRQVGGGFGVWGMGQGGHVRNENGEERRGEEGQREIKSVEGAPLHLRHTKAHTRTRTRTHA